VELYQLVRRRGRLGLARRDPWVGDEGGSAWLFPTFVNSLTINDLDAFWAGFHNNGCGKGSQLSALSLYSSRGRL